MVDRRRGADTLASISPVCETMRQERPEIARGTQTRAAAMAVVQMCGRDVGDQEAAIRLG